MGDARARHRWAELREDAPAAWLLWMAMSMVLPMAGWMAYPGPLRPRQRRDERRDGAPDARDRRGDGRRRGRRRRHGDDARARPDAHRHARAARGVRAPSPLSRWPRGWARQNRRTAAENSSGRSRLT